MCLHVYACNGLLYVEIQNDIEYTYSFDITHLLFPTAASSSCISICEIIKNLKPWRGSPGN